MKENKQLPTQGEWKVSDPKYNFIDIEVDGRRVCVIVNDEEDCDNKDRANAHAISTAINNTYQKGIDPGKVPSILQALKNKPQNY